MLADARNYMDRLQRYALKRYGDGVKIDVENDGRSVTFIRPNHDGRGTLDILEHGTFEDLAKHGALPDIPRFKY